MAKHWVANGPEGLGAFDLAEYTPAQAGPGQVTIKVRAAGMNPFDLKQPAMLPPNAFPHAIGQELAGIVTAVGEGARAVNGPLSVGDKVLAYGHGIGAWATEVTVDASTVFLRPDGLGEPEAAGLLLAGTTAADLVHTVGLVEGETVFVSGASGGVGQILTQLATDLGARVIGTSSAAQAENVTRWGGEQLDYGPGIMDRVRAIAPEGVDAAVDLSGDQEAVDAAFDLLKDKAAPRFATIVASERHPRSHEFFVGGMGSHGAYRRDIREQLVDMAGEGRLHVTIAKAFPLEDGLEAAQLLASGHAGGKLVLVP